jgi:hypothetical protein
MSGGVDAALFVEAPPDWASCAVCLAVLRNPVNCARGHRRARGAPPNEALACSPARARAPRLLRAAPPRARLTRAPPRSFCRTCLATWLRTKSTCPVDRGPVASIKDAAPNLALRGALACLRLRCCPHDSAPPASKKRQREAELLREAVAFTGSRGLLVAPPPRCTWSGALGDLNAHLRACALERLKCRWQGCTFGPRPRYEMQAHEAACSERTVHCEHCKADFWPADWEAHVEECEEWPAPCTGGGCGALVPRADLPDHERYDCPATIVDCPVDGCSKRLPRRQLPAHLASTAKAHVALLARHFQRMLADAAAAAEAAGGGGADEADEGEEDEEDEEAEEEEDEEYDEA